MPTVDEYMRTSVDSFAADPSIHTALYFIGPLISDKVVCSSEFHKLSMVVGIIGRILNDIASFEVICLLKAF